MSEEVNKAQTLKQLKMLLVLPMIAVPLISLAFYGLGGGKGVKKAASGETGGKGYNMRLPGARFDSKKDNSMDKMAFYEKADQDSAKLRDQMNEDPYHAHLQPSKRKSLDTLRGVRGFSDKQIHAIAPITPVPGSQDTAADLVIQRLNQLKKLIGKPTAVPVSNNFAPSGFPDVAPGHSDQMSRLARMMQSLKTADSGSTDPQMDRLSGMLDKIIRIQHPGLDTARPREAAGGLPKPLNVQSNSDEPTVGDMTGPDLGGDRQASQGGNVFLSIDEDQSSDTGYSNMIRAVVQADQTIVSGGSIVLRLTHDALINGVNIPRDDLIYGVVSLTGERLNVNVSSIRIKNGIYPVALQLFDQDGLPGIHVPGAITRDVAKASANDAIGAIGMTSLDPSLGAQAASAGIQAAKSLVSKKVRLVRISVRAGYEIFLKNIKGDLH